MVVSIKMVGNGGKLGIIGYHTMRENVRYKWLQEIHDQRGGQQTTSKTLARGKKRRQEPGRTKRVRVEVDLAARKKRQQSSWGRDNLSVRKKRRWSHKKEDTPRQEYRTKVGISTH